MGPGIILLCIVCVTDTVHQSAGRPGVSLDETRLSETDVEDLAWLLVHPLDLNRATEAELAQCCLISPAEATDILDLRRRLGGFSRVADLRVLGADLVERLKPYVHVGPRSGRSMRSQTREFAEARLRASWKSERESDNRSAWLGSPVHEYGRLAVRPWPALELGMVAEKDPGERWRDGFVSAYAMVRHAGALSVLVAGDYVVQAGEGLLLGKASMLSSSGSPSAGARTEFLRPSRYTDESGFFRGVGATVALPLNTRGSEIALSGFLSRRERDAAARESTEEVTLYDEGLFRTASEVERRNIVREDAAGFRCQIAVDQGAILGLTGYACAFSRPVPVDASGATSRGTGAGAADLSLRFGGLTLAGEIAPSRAAVALTMRSRPRAEFTAGLRVCNTSQQALHAASGAAESGAFLRCRLIPLDWLRLLGAVDRTRPLREVRRTGSSRQNAEMTLQADVALTRETDLSVRWRQRSSETIVAERDVFMRDIRMLVPRSARTLCCAASLRLTQSVTARLRWEENRVKYPMLARGSAGVLLSQSLWWKPARDLTVTASIAFFDTDGYESRVYELEEDVRGAFSLPPLYGEGRRWYVCARWRLADNMAFSAKVASSDIHYRPPAQGPWHETSLTVQLDTGL